MRARTPRSQQAFGAAIFAAPFAVGAFAAGVVHAQGPNANPVPPPVFHSPKNGRAAKINPPGVPGAPNPVQIIVRMVRAGLAQPFLAREVTLSKEGHETEQWVRWDPKRGMRFDAIRPTSGDVLLDNYKQSWAYTQRDKKWTVRDSLLPRLNGRVKDVLRRIGSGELRTEWVGEELVAGRPADIVRVFPPDNTPGTSRKFWIDRQTGIRLKLEEIAPGGKTLSSSYLLSLDLSPRFGKDDFTPPPEACQAAPNKLERENRQHFKTLDEAIQAGYSPKQPSYLPTGYSLRVVEVAGEHGSERITQRYANGISVISLIQSTKTPFGRKLLETLGPSQMGFVALPRGDRAYLWHDNTSGLNLALISNLPDDQTKRISSSVK